MLQNNPTGKIRIVSGIQASGKLHLGNYFGAIKQHIELQENPQHDAFYFIANYHSLTTIQDPQLLQQYSNDIALDYLALGLDPQKATFFRQSDVPEVTELAWILSTVTTMGLLERAHSYKDKIAKGIKPNVGLFFYPVLMAADILIYHANQVPVGVDQVQHIEITQDIAQYFNNTYHTSLFTYPNAKLNQTPKVPGIDGDKMSKSYHNTIDLQIEGKELEKVVMRIKTDSTPVEEPKDPEQCHLFTLYQLFATSMEQTELAERYRAGGLGYGEVKKLLLQKITDYFASYRAKRKELAQHPDYVAEVLKNGALRAREIASQTLSACRKACGLD